ncbi:MAG TPA: hypothetical protein VK473_06685 [Terriglobales bacterium]|nr:hypothetical protein [Terriglobales bacterium]
MNWTSKHLSPEAIARLKQLGYSPSRRIRMYGEIVEIVSDPFIEDEWIVVRAVVLRSSKARTLRIPLTVIQSLSEAAKAA